MAKTFNLETRVRPSSLLARAKKAAYENGATLLGDERSGRFSHDMAEGEYRMVGRTVIVTVTEKHWLLPWPVVEAQLRELVLQTTLACSRRATLGPQAGRVVGDQAEGAVSHGLLVLRKAKTRCPWGDSGKGKGGAPGLLTPIVYAQGYTRVTARQELGNNALPCRSPTEHRMLRKLRHSQLLHYAASL